MPSYQIALTPTKRAGGRFILAVRRALQAALVEENKKNGITQSDIARQLGVHRSVINRELRGEADLSLGRVGEFARALGRRAVISFLPIAAVQGHEPVMPPVSGTVSFTPPVQTSALPASRAGSTAQNKYLDAA